MHITDETSKWTKVFEDSFAELNEFYGLDWTQNKPKIIFVPDRMTIDQLRGRKTEDWEVGWTDKGIIYLLAEENYEKESSHRYSYDEYAALIKHELAHLFTGMIAGQAHKPVWLNEGLSIFLSGQNAFKKRPEKLEHFIDYYDKRSKNVYYESGFAVEYLIKRYGKEKILQLLRNLNKQHSPQEFREIFKEIYGIELEYENFKIEYI